MYQKHNSIMMLKKKNCCFKLLKSFTSAKIRKNIFACLFSVHNTVRLSRLSVQMMGDVSLET